MNGAKSSPRAWRRANAVGRSAGILGEQLERAIADAVHAGPNGFYEGMSVKHAEPPSCCAAPPVNFIGGVSKQLTLF